MKSENHDPAVADAAASWVATGTVSVRVRRAWDLGVVARIIADALGRPPVASEPKAYLRKLRRLDWPDLDPVLVSQAVAAFGPDHSPATDQRLVATWSSFLGWLADSGYPVPAASAGLVLMPTRTAGRARSDVGRLVAEAICTGHRTQDAWAERDRAMVGVIVAGELSLGHVTLLLLSDVSQEGGGSTWLRSRSHQGKERVVELPSKVAGALDDYLDSRRARELRRPAPDLFVRAGSGKPYTAETLRYLYVGWYRRAGLAVPRDPPSVALRPVYNVMMGGSLGAK